MDLLWCCLQREALRLLGRSSGRRDAFATNCACREDANLLGVPQLAQARALVRCRRPDLAFLRSSGHNLYKVNRFVKKLKFCTMDLPTIKTALLHVQQHQRQAKSDDQGSRQFLKVGRTIYRLAAAKQIPAFKVGGTLARFRVTTSTTG